MEDNEIVGRCPVFSTPAEARKYLGHFQKERDREICEIVPVEFIPREDG